MVTQYLGDLYLAAYFSIGCIIIIFISILKIFNTSNTHHKHYTSNNRQNNIYPRYKYISTAELEDKIDKMWHFYMSPHRVTPINTDIYCYNNMHNVHYYLHDSFILCNHNDLTWSEWINVYWHITFKLFMINHTNNLRMRIKVYLRVIQRYINYELKGIIQVKLEKEKNQSFGVDTPENEYMIPDTIQRIIGEYLCYYATSCLTIKWASLSHEYEYGGIVLFVTMTNMNKWYDIDSTRNMSSITLNEYDKTNEIAFEISVGRNELGNFV